MLPACHRTHAPHALQAAATASGRQWDSLHILWKAIGHRAMQMGRGRGVAYGGSKSTEPSGKAHTAGPTHHGRTCARSSCLATSGRGWPHVAWRAIGRGAEKRGNGVDWHRAPRRWALRASGSERASDRDAGSRSRCLGGGGTARDSYIYRYTAHTQGCEVGDDVVGRSDRVHTHVFNERELGVVGESALVWGGPRSVP